MNAPRHLARYLVLCADRSCRHSGFFHSQPQASWWAAHPGCCGGVGDHKVVRAAAWSKAVA